MSKLKNSKRETRKQGSIKRIHKKKNTNPLRQLTIFLLISIMMLGTFAHNTPIGHASEYESQLISELSQQSEPGSSQHNEAFAYSIHQSSEEFSSTEIIFATPDRYLPTHMLPEILEMELDNISLVPFGSEDEPLYIHITYTSSGHTHGVPPGDENIFAPGYLSLPISDMEKEGYVFGGWRNASGFVLQPGQRVTWENEIGGSVTLDAHWVPFNSGEVIIQFLSNGHTSGQPPAPIQAIPNSSVAMPGQGSLQRNGFTFVGWALSGDEQTQIWRPGNSPGFEDGTHTATAVWVQNGTVLFHYRGWTGGGFFPPNETRSTPTSFMVAGQGSLTNPGNVFGGWRVNDNNSRIYWPGTVINTNHSSVPFYSFDAYWIPIAQAASVTFRLNDGTSVQINRTARMNNPIRTLIPPDPSRFGHTFLGWFTAQSGGQQVTPSTMIHGSSVEFWAQWAPLGSGTTPPVGTTVPPTSPPTTSWQTTPAPTTAMPTTSAPTTPAREVWYQLSAGSNVIYIREPATNNSYIQATVVNQFGLSTGRIFENNSWRVGGIPHIPGRGSFTWAEAPLGLESYDDARFNTDDNLNYDFESEVPIAPAYLPLPLVPTIIAISAAAEAMMQYVIWELGLDNRTMTAGDREIIRLGITVAIIDSIIPETPIVCARSAARSLVFMTSEHSEASLGSSFLYVGARVQTAFLIYGVANIASLGSLHWAAPTFISDGVSVSSNRVYMGIGFVGAQNQPFSASATPETLTTLGKTAGVVGLIALGNLAYRQIASNALEITRVSGVQLSSLVLVEAEERALRERDAAVNRAMLTSTSVTQLRRHVTIVAGYAIVNGRIEIALGAKYDGNPTHIGKCAEDLASEQLIARGAVLTDIVMTPAIRPYQKQIIPVCHRCQSRYEPSNFLPGTPHLPGGPWDWRGISTGSPRLHWFQNIDWNYVHSD